MSSDGGETWAGQRHEPELTDPVCQASIRRSAWPADNKPGVILFSNPASHKRERMTLRASFDDGQTWPVRQLVEPGPSAYSCLAMLPDATIGLLYESGAKSAYEEIVLARVSMGWLTQRDEGRVRTGQLEH